MFTQGKVLKCSLKESVKMLNQRKMFTQLKCYNVESKKSVKMFTQLKCYNVHSKKSVKMFTQRKC